jgi:hypothetical protein
MTRRFSPIALFVALVSFWLLAGLADVGAQTDPSRQSVQQRLDLSRAELDQIGSILRREQVADQELASR